MPSNPDIEYPTFEMLHSTFYIQSVADLGEGPGGPGPSLILGEKIRNEAGQGK